MVPVVVRWHQGDPGDLDQLALVHPYAVGASNTVLFESEADMEFTDGRHAVEHEVGVIEIRGGKATNIRVHVADEDGAKVLMGARAT